MNRTHKWIAYQSLMTARMALMGISAPFCRQQSDFVRRSSIIPQRHQLTFRQR
ncbi:MAG: hypothetical protein VB070_04600 [Clostridiaceae bacterium]|nr:hypothetical protein [Clostridiaceae bacterium]